MYTTKTKPLGYILAFTQIAVAVFTFDRNDANTILVSVLLVLGAVLMLSAGSESSFFRTANSVLGYLAVVISVAVVVRVLFYS